MSLLIAEGRSIVEVARQAGHSATMALDTYGHVFDELEGAERISAEEAIRKARAEARATLVRPAPDRVARKKNETPRVQGILQALSRTRTVDPSLPCAACGNRSQLHGNRSGFVHALPAYRTCH